MGVSAKVSVLCLIWQITFPAQGVKWPIKDISTISKLPMTSLSSLPTPQLGNPNPEKETNNINDNNIDAVSASSYNIKQINKPRYENKYVNIDKICNDGKEDRIPNSIKPFMTKQYTKDSPSKDEISYFRSHPQAISSPNVLQKVNINDRIKEAQSANGQGIVNSDVRENFELSRELEDKTNLNTKQENSLNALYNVHFDTNSDSDITNLIRCKNSINNFLPRMNCENSVPETNYNTQNNYNNLFNVKSLPYTYVNNQNVEVDKFPFNDNLNKPINKEDVLKYFQKNRNINEINNKVRPDFSTTNMGVTELYVFENNVNKGSGPQTFKYNNQQQFPSSNNVNIVNNDNTNFKSINNAPVYRNPAEEYQLNINPTTNTLGSKITSFNNVFTDVGMPNALGPFTNTAQTSNKEAENAKLCDTGVFYPDLSPRNNVMYNQPPNTIRNPFVPNNDITFNYKPGFIEIQTDFKNCMKESTSDITNLESSYPIPKPLNVNSVKPVNNPFNIPNILPNAYPAFGQSVRQLPYTELPSKVLAEYNSISPLPSITSPTKSCIGQQNTIPNNNFEQIPVKSEFFNPIKPILSAPYSSGFDISNILSRCNNDSPNRPDFQVQNDNTLNNYVNGQSLAQNTFISVSPNIENDISCKNPTAKVDLYNSYSPNNINTFTISNTNFNNFASPFSNNILSQVTAQFTGLDDNPYKMSNNFIPNVNLPQNLKQDFSQSCTNNEFAMYPIPQPVEKILQFTGLADNLNKLSNNFISNVNIPQITPQNSKQDNPYSQFNSNNDFAFNPMPQTKAPQFQSQSRSANNIQLETPVSFINYESASYQRPNLPPVNLYSQNSNKAISYQNSKCDDSKLSPLQYTSSLRETKDIPTKTYLDGINRNIFQSPPDYNSFKGLTTSPLPVLNLAPISNLPNVSPSRNLVKTQAVQPTYTYANVVSKNPLASQVEKILSPSGIVGSITEAANAVAKNVLSTVIAKKLKEKRKVPPPNLPPVNPYSNKSYQTCSCPSPKVNEPPCSYPCSCSNVNVNEPPCFRDFYYQTTQPTQTSKPRTNSQLYNGFEVPDVISSLNYDIKDLPNNMFNVLASDKPDWNYIMEPAITQAIPYLNSVTVNIVPVTEDFGYEVRNIPNLLNYDLPNVPGLPNIPNYLNFELPNVPYLPNTPNVLNFEFPNFPCMQNIPNVLNLDLPSVPCTPNTPNVLNFEFPNIPCLPNTPNVLNFELPSISFLPTPNINIPNPFDGPMNPFNTFNYDIPFVIPSYLPTPNINMVAPQIPQIIDVPAITASIRSKDTNELNRILELVVLSELMNNNEFIDADALETAVTLMLLS